MEGGSTILWAGSGERWVDHNGASSLALGAGGGVRVEVLGTANKEVLRIVDGGLDVREEEIVIIREGL